LNGVAKKRLCISRSRRGATRRGFSSRVWTNFRDVIVFFLFGGSSYRVQVLLVVHAFEIKSLVSPSSLYVYSSVRSNYTRSEINQRLYAGEKGADSNVAVRVLLYRKLIPTTTFTLMLYPVHNIIALFSYKHLLRYLLYRLYLYLLHIRTTKSVKEAETDGEASYGKRSVDKKTAIRKSSCSVLLF
jgi:hypothetical protein